MKMGFKFFITGRVSIKTFLSGLGNSKEAHYNIKRELQEVFQGPQRSTMWKRVVTEYMVKAIISY